MASVSIPARGRWSRAWEAIDERLGLSGLAYPVPAHANGIGYILGGITFFGFLILARAFRTNDYVTMLGAVRGRCPDLRESLVLEEGWEKLLADGDLVAAVLELPAERRVVDLASSGLSNPEIAETLVIARKTVEWHLSKAFGKLDVSSREELPEHFQR